MTDGGPAQPDDGAWSGVRPALAWLASPVTVLALVVLAVNDHVLKQAHPGPVTGKLSDVAGLVAAPALLATVLACLALPRPRETALVATGLGFALVKTVPGATDAANALWTSFGVTTEILRDPTDLVALPALALAWIAARRTQRPRGLRARARVALGAVVLPLAVVTTAATSCYTPDGVTGAAVVRGDWAGGDAVREDRVVVGGPSGDSVTVDAGGRVLAMSRTDEARLPRGDDGEPVPYCSRSDTDRCWTGVGTTSTTVAGTTDGGRTWTVEYDLPREEADDLRDRYDGCSEPSLDVAAVIVLDGPYGPVVVVPAHVTGLLVRGTDGTWTRLPLDQLPGEPATDEVPRFTGPLRYREPPRPVPDDQPGPTPTPSLPSTPPCPSPTTVRVTPDPRNGPPFDRVDCPP